MKTTSASIALILLASGALAAPPPRFPAGSVWHQDIRDAPAHPDSASMIATLDGLQGWGPAGGVNHRMHIDFSIIVTDVPAGQNPPNVPVVQHAVYDDYYSPDCEAPGTTIPLPANAAFEDDGDNNPLACDNENNDCHLIVVKDKVLYEVYSGNYNGAQIDALCLVKWDLNVVYPGPGRGEHCTSADAAGFPMAPLMPNADEVAAAVALNNGADLGHAIRFILPNPRMASFPDDGDADTAREPMYVRPASHAGGPSGPEATVPYGSRLRLRADFPFDGYNEAARVILRTMQRYGIVLSDGGNIALTFASDVNTTAKWSDPAINVFPQVFWSGTSTPANNRRPVRVTDFTVLATGPRILETYDCEPTNIVIGAKIFMNGLE